MKISKRQLKRIIKEEKAKLLRESITDMNKYDAAFDDFSMKVADMFEADMMQLYEEEPDAFARPGPDGGMTRDSREDWNEQVVYAAQEIETSVAEAIRRAVETIEAQLHDGDYKR